MAWPSGMEPATLSERGHATRAPPRHHLASFYLPLRTSPNPHTYCANINANKLQLNTQLISFLIIYISDIIGWIVDLQNQFLNQIT